MFSSNVTLSLSLSLSLPLSPPLGLLYVVFLHISPSLSLSHLPPSLPPSLNRPLPEIGWSRRKRNKTLAAASSQGSLEELPHGAATLLQNLKRCFFFDTDHSSSQDRGQHRKPHIACPKHLKHKRPPGPLANGILPTSVLEPGRTSHQVVVLINNMVQGYPRSSVKRTLIYPPWSPTMAHSKKSSSKPTPMVLSSFKLNCCKTNTCMRTPRRFQTTSSVLKKSRNGCVERIDQHIIQYIQNRNKSKSKYIEPMQIDGPFRPC